MKENLIKAIEIEFLFEALVRAVAIVVQCLSCCGLNILVDEVKCSNLLNYARQSPPYLEGNVWTH